MAWACRWWPARAPLRLWQRQRRLRQQALQGHAQLPRAEGRRQRHLDLGQRLRSCKKAACQLADGPLVSGEQMSAGGANSVRGYLSAEATGDYGLLHAQNGARRRWHVLAAAWRTGVCMPLPKARACACATNARSESLFGLASVGLGSSSSLRKWLNGSIDWAYPLREGPRTSNRNAPHHSTFKPTF